LSLLPLTECGLCLDRTRPVSTGSHCASTQSTGHGPSEDQMR
jgi:hypothetical protein